MPCGVPAIAREFTWSIICGVLTFGVDDDEPEEPDDPEEDD